MLGGISYTNDVAELDPRPQPGSPVYADVLSGAPVAVAYRGAFSGPTDGWADGWTALSSLGYLKPAQTVEPPVIVTQPESTVTVFPGDVATLSVTATGEAPLSYQWAKDGVAMVGATSSIWFSTWLMAWLCPTISLKSWPPRISSCK